ncbi:MAG: ArsR/SmtB family transcription factor [Alphaproteobacteria bacterium]
MERFATALKVLGHTERLRILALLSSGELTVSELVQIMGLSQPRITQYIKSLEEAGILERLKEGSWVFSRLRRGNEAISALVATTLASLPQDDPALVKDRRRLDDVRRERAKSAAAFFVDVANDRGQLGDEYLPRENIESAIRAIVGGDGIEFMVDLGTGTGRVLEVLSSQVKRGSGVDNNVDMLKVARHKLSDAGRTHLTVRQGDLYAAPFENGVADLVTLHQVLHYLEDPQDAIFEAARLLGSGGKILIVDFVPHEHETFRAKYAHRRLGFSDADIQQWMGESGATLTDTQTIPSEGDRPDVRLWLGVMNTFQRKTS